MVAAAPDFRLHQIKARAGQAAESGAMGVKHDKGRLKTRQTGFQTASVFSDDLSQAG
ncbi:hypothetical protein HMPREF9120_00347 [Neisseria sp. oral taxon 020 str. F0370]|uniref:hypothetical protein n=1 Tax=unclassified Neisseria TaxID=2623750 RepID=UPI0002A369BC|nr:MULTISPECIES: hypothetical protein [unclassified Neisseria]EKY09642.1 hypothetical protein HMPREF9120_00347 [Neisseria sp. oral taxon 020 str. F0370]